MARRFLASTALTAAMAALAPLTAQAQSFQDGQTFAFGDSLSDVGSRFAQTGGRDNAFAPQVSPNGALYNTAFPLSLTDPTAGTPSERFTNGDNHIDLLAGDLTPVVGNFDPEAGAEPVPGTPLAAPVTVNPELTFDPQAAGPDGFGFAHGGATTGLTDANGQNVSFLSQVAAFTTLQGGGQISVGADDVATVWIGGNDFFDAAQAGTLSAETVETAVTNVGIGLNTLAASGVQNIVVYTLPDLSQVPLAGELAEVGGAPELLPSLQQLTTAFNAQLETSVVAPLRDDGVNVRVVDVEALFRDLARQPKAYGLRDASTHCFSLVSESPTGDCDSAEKVAETTFLDSLHPTATGHEIIAQFAQGSLFTVDTGPSALGAVPQLTLLGLDGHNNAIATRLHAVRAGARGLDFLGNAFAGADDARAEAEGDNRLSVFVFGNYNGGSRDAGAGAAGFDYDQQLFTVGADYTINDSVLVGGAAGYSRNEGDLDGGLGEADIDSVLVTLYGSAKVGNFYGDFAGTLGFDSHDLTRRTDGPLGEADGDTDGQSLSLTFTGGYNFHVDNFTFGPTAGLRFLDTEIEDFEETGAGALNLDVDNMEADAAIGSFGAQASARFALGDGSLIVPQLAISYEHDFADDHFGFTSRLPGGQPVTRRIGVGQDDAAVIDGGVSLALVNGISAQLGGRVSLGRDGDDHSVRGRLRYSF